MSLWNQIKSAAKVQLTPQQKKVAASAPDVERAARDSIVALKKRLADTTALAAHLTGERDKLTAKIAASGRDIRATLARFGHPNPNSFFAKDGSIREESAEALVRDVQHFIEVRNFAAASEVCASHGLTPHRR